MCVDAFCGLVSFIRRVVYNLLKILLVNFHVHDVFEILSLIFVFTRSIPTKKFLSIAWPSIKWTCFRVSQFRYICYIKAWIQADRDLGKGFIIQDPLLWRDCGRFGDCIIHQFLENKDRSKEGTKQLQKIFKGCLSFVKL